MGPNQSGSVRLFTLFGISVFIHWTWLLAAVVMYQFYGESYTFFVTYPALFGIVLLHEFGHSLACRSVGGRAEKITLFPLGGIAYVQPPHRPGAVLWSIAAGPLVNVLLIPVSAIAWVYLIGDTPGDQWTVTQQVVEHLAYVNVILLIFNMLPIYPLDGGQIVQALLWFMVGYRRSLFAVAVFGMAAAGVLGLWALMNGRIYMILMAGFMGMQAWRGYQHAKLLGQMEMGFEPLKRF